MKPIHKFNGGMGATLCHNCSVIITVGFSDDCYCLKCLTENYMKETAVDWLAERLEDALTFKDIEHLITQAKKIEEEQNYQIKAFWFGRGILAQKENRINELKPLKE